MAVPERFSELNLLWDFLQVATRLEDDLGVKVQEVHFPELRYSFQIWDTYMGLSDKEGKVGPHDSLILMSALMSVGINWTADNVYRGRKDERIQGKRALVAFSVQDTESINPVKESRLSNLFSPQPTVTHTLQSPMAKHQGLSWVLKCFLPSASSGVRCIDGGLRTSSVACVGAAEVDVGKVWAYYGCYW